MFGEDLEERFGRFEQVRDLIASQRDVYKYLNDQTLRLANHGLTMTEIAEQLELPEVLTTVWANRGYYDVIAYMPAEMLLDDTAIRLDPAKNAGAEFSFALELSDRPREPFELWVENAVHDYRKGSVDATLRLDTPTLAMISTGALKIPDAIEQGKLSIEGDQAKLESMAAAANAANNPLAQLIGVNIHNYYVPTWFGDSELTTNALNLRIIAPIWRILPRVTLPIVTQRDQTARSEPGPATSTCSSRSC